MCKLWHIAQPISSNIVARFPELDAVLLQLLLNRGINTQQQIDEFLNPDWDQDVHDPYLFCDMKKAVERVYEAIGDNEIIAVFGDYDADGVTATTMLVDTIKKLGGTVQVYLPHREREGYGLNNDAIKYLFDKGVKLLITCDCGISNVTQVAYANSLGLRVIITDHHQPQETLPAAYAILHCGLQEETYPFKYLSGGGVAFKFVQGLLRYDGCHLSNAEKESWEKWLLDLVAISTVADMVKLTGESRTLTKYGLTVLQKTKRLGLRKLIETAGLKFDNLDTYSIGFQIAPRINAAGRLDHANAAYALLMSSNETQATELARSLNLTNVERQRITDEMFALACEQIGVIKHNQFFVHAYAPEWSLGMVGLVAGKLVQEYNRPALVMCDNGDGIVAGSGRAGIGNFDLGHALSECKELLNSYGGHKEAAGFNLPKQNLELFINKFSGLAYKLLKDVNLSPEINIDSVLSLPQVDWNLLEQVKKMEPTGQGNKTARFVSYHLTVQDFRPVGTTGQHLKLVLMSDNVTRKFILFRQGELSTKLTIGSIVDVVYEVGVNEWNGNRELELKVVDLKINI